MKSCTGRATRQVVYRCTGCRPWLYRAGAAIRATRSLKSPSVARRINNGRLPPAPACDHVIGTLLIQSKPPVPPFLIFLCYHLLKRLFGLNNTAMLVF